ncbi:MAG: hypothetical protein M1829_001775 [Trizodia sp. TS-e1964]|nr:MAG: hypothetical protein M1829_001775 [Trizodia sp. TS-e1964]
MGRTKKRKIRGAEMQKPSSQARRPARKIPPAPSSKNAKAEVTAKQKPQLPFEAEDSILLIGEGDFSYARALVATHGCAAVLATCYDSKDALAAKYPQAREHVEYLEQEEQRVLYSVDATKLEGKVLRNGGGWDTIVFNFPHVGGLTRDVNRQVRHNQGERAWRELGVKEFCAIQLAKIVCFPILEMLVGFFKAAVKILKHNGTIIVTVFEGEPYSLWNLKDLARHVGLRVGRSFKFQSEAYPGYKHARTLGNINGDGWKGEDRAARSYIFEMNDDASGQPKAAKPPNGKRKRVESSSDED